MTTPRRLALSALCVLLSAAVWPLASRAFANAQIGDPVENAELPTLDGGKAQLLSKKALANVFVFFRPGQDHSLTTLKWMAECEREFAGKPVHWAAVVSSTWEAEDVRAFVREAGVKMPVLVDEGDKLYGALGVRLHPVIGVTDDQFALFAFEPFHKINYCDRVRGKIRYLLHEIDLAELDLADNPARALFPNEIKGAVTKRHVRMGEALLRTKQYGKALDEAKQILEKEPAYAPAHVLLGQALAAQGHCDDAARAYDAALKLDPQNAAAAAGKRACAAR
ncbi:MAG: tetratricopeptide repeat protein [Anaeromyxobacteraceae bacterium]